jgi:hypothetical protein
MERNRSMIGHVLHASAADNIRFASSSVMVSYVAVAEKKYAAWMGLLALVQLALFLLSGLYLFVRPYTIKWRNARRAD